MILGPEGLGTRQGTIDDVVVPVCQLQFGLLPFVFFRPNGVLPALKSMIVRSMNQTFLIRRPSRSLNNMEEGNLLPW